MTQPLTITHTATPPFPSHERILLINADDLGLSPEANGAIDELLACGAITSATIMTPAVYAAEAVIKPEYAIGVHFTLTGRLRPLSPPSLVPSLVGSHAAGHHRAGASSGAARPVLMRQSGCTNTGSCSTPIFGS
jgi:hypothetical protein